MSTINLFKFRSLATPNEYCRAKQILESGEFWHAKFWQMNDPMEGVYSIPTAHRKLFPTDQIFNGKSSRIICSFSGHDGFADPSMWGYYANGFRGCAIETQVDSNSVSEVQYCDDVRSLQLGDHEQPIDISIEQILTTKLDRWRREDEYRSILDEKRPRLHAVGQVIRVHFGMPYWHTAQQRVIEMKSKELADYYTYCTHLAEIALENDIECRVAAIDGNTVYSEEWDGLLQRPAAPRTRGARRR